MRELRHAAERPTWEEMREWLARLPRVELHDVGAAQIIREDRDRR